MGEDQNTTKVDPNTDNLDDFEKLMFGTAEPVVTDDTTPKPDKTDKTEDDEPVKEDTPTDAGDETAENEDDDKDPDEASEEKPKSKTKSRFQERFDKLTERNKDLSDRLEAAIAKLDEKATTSVKEPVQEAAPLEAEAPKPDQKLENGEEKYPLGEFDPLYIRDLTRFTIEQEAKAAEVRAEDRRQAQEKEQAKQALQSEWTEKLKVAREEIPDLESGNSVLEETFRHVEPNYGEYLAATIMSMDHGVEVLHYLGQNVEEAKRIVASGPTKATLALGRLESRFIKSEEKPKPRQSSAPPPPPTQNKGNSGRTVTPGDTDDLDAFEKEFFKKK